MAINWDELELEWFTKKSMYLCCIVYKQMLVSHLVVGSHMARVLISIQRTGSKGEGLNLSQAEDSYSYLGSDY